MNNILKKSTIRLALMLIAMTVTLTVAIINGESMFKSIVFLICPVAFLIYDLATETKFKLSGVSVFIVLVNSLMFFTNETIYGLTFVATLIKMYFSFKNHGRFYT